GGERALLADGAGASVPLLLRHAGLRVGQLVLVEGPAKLVGRQVADHMPSSGRRQASAESDPDGQRRPPLDASASGRARRGGSPVPRRRLLPWATSATRRWRTRARPGPPLAGSAPRARRPPGRARRARAAGPPRTPASAPPRARGAPARGQAPRGCPRA